MKRLPLDSNESTAHAAAHPRASHARSHARARARSQSRAWPGTLAYGRPLVVAFALALAACGGPGDEPLRLEQDGVALEVALDPATPRVGDNALLLSLHDAAGRPIEDAHVEASVSMPAMGAMAAMGGPASVTSLGSGRHRADFELAMGSTWQVEIRAHTTPDRGLRAEGSLTVGSPDLRLALVSAPAAPAAGADHAQHEEHAAPSTPATRAHPAELVLPPERLQRIGVTLVRAEQKPLATALRVVGRVVAPEPDQVDVSLKLRGWAARIGADAVGVAVQKGDVLFEVDSPELAAAANEWVEALRSQARARSSSAPDRADGLVEAGRSRLLRFGLDAGELARIERTLEVGPTLPIRAPITGYVVEKNVVQGAAFEAGQRLYRLAPLTRIWVEAEVYDADQAQVAVGLKARVAPTHAPERVVEAPVTLVSPGLDPGSRATRVRIELANPGLALRPEQLVDVELALAGREAIVVPESAVLRAGKRSFVFLALGEGRFRPQAVETGRRVGEEVEIVSGLAAGDEIVRSGTFLIAAESRLRAALEQW